MNTQIVNERKTPKTKLVKEMWYLLTLSHDSCGEPTIKSHDELYSDVEVEENHDGDYIFYSFLSAKPSPLLSSLLYNNDPYSFMKVSEERMKELGFCGNKWDYRSDWVLICQWELNKLVKTLSPHVKPIEREF